MRAFLFGGLLAIGSIWGAFAEPVLKQQITVERDMVRLGDLFDALPTGADPSADVVRAPAPGQRHTLDATALMGIANSQRIGWKPSGRFDRVVVERAGQVIGAAVIREAVA